MPPHSAKGDWTITQVGGASSLLFFTAIEWSLPSIGTSASGRVAVVASPATVAFSTPSTSIFVATAGSAVPGFRHATVTVPSAFRLQGTLSTGRAQAPCDAVLVGSKKESLPKTPGFRQALPPSSLLAQVIV